MDEKTAPIPSLKGFKEQRKERSAQSERTGSMQTKGQMRRSADSKKTSGASASSRTAANGRSGASSSGSTKKKTPAAAPRTYARERNASNEQVSRRGTSSGADYDSSRRVERTAQTQKRTNSQRNGGEGRPSGSSDSQQQRGTSSRSRSSASSSSRNRKPQSTPPQKNRKPLSPAARKFRSIVFSVLIVLTVIIIGVVLSLTVLFKTETINVSGNGVYSKQDIIDASGLVLGDNIFTSPKSRAESKIEKKFPYIEHAEIYSVFPNSINIDLTLAEPACVVEGLGGFYIVSDKGKVLEVSSTDDEAGVPVLEGVEVKGAEAGDMVEYGSDLIGAALEEIFAAFGEFGCTDITAINITADGDSFSIRYVYDDRIVVKVGLPENISYKIQTAHTIITEKIDVEGTMIAGVLDVSSCYDTMKSYFNQYNLLSPDLEGSGESTTRQVY